MTYTADSHYTLKDLKNYRRQLANYENLELELNRAQSRIEELETALTESTQKLEKACSVLERANALTENQARIIRRLVDDSVENTELKEANDAIRFMQEVLSNSIDHAEWTFRPHKKAIDRALKES